MSEKAKAPTSKEPFSHKGQNRQYRKLQLTQNNPEQHGLTAQIMREKVLAMEGIQYACGWRRSQRVERRISTSSFSRQAKNALQL